MRNYLIPSCPIASGRLPRCSAYVNLLVWRNQSTSSYQTRHLLSRKVQQALGTNLEGEEAAEATEVVAAQAVVAVDIRAGGVAAIEVPDRRAI
jgi:hypothetical protein